MFSPALRAARSAMVIIGSMVLSWLAGGRRGIIAASLGRSKRGFLLCMFASPRRDDHGVVKHGTRRKYVHVGSAAATPDKAGWALHGCRRSRTALPHGRHSFCFHQQRSPRHFKPAFALFSFFGQYQLKCAPVAVPAVAVGYCCPGPSADMDVCSEPPWMDLRRVPGGNTRQPKRRS